MSVSVLSRFPLRDCFFVTTFVVMEYLGLACPLLVFFSSLTIGIFTLVSSAVVDVGICTLYVSEVDKITCYKDVRFNCLHVCFLGKQSAS